MFRVVENLFVNWSRHMVKNVFNSVDKSTTLVLGGCFWGVTHAYTPTSPHQPMRFSHMIFLIFTSVKQVLIPTIHSAYNYQRKENLNKTNSRRVLV